MGAVVSGHEDHDKVADLLSVAIYRALIEGAEAWARLHVTMPQLKVLMLLGRHGSAPVSWLASLMQVSPPNVTGILDRLESQGWVQRTNDQRDRRVVRVMLTGEGERMLRELHAAGQARVREVVYRLAPADREALRRGLSALLTAAGAGSADGTFDWAPSAAGPTRP
jgi:DNA-binding MarR family transcriptional regulator